MWTRSLCPCGLPTVGSNYEPASQRLAVPPGCRGWHTLFSHSLTLSHTPSHSLPHPHTLSGWREDGLRGRSPSLRATWTRSLCPYESPTVGSKYEPASQRLAAAPGFRGWHTLAHSSALSHTLTLTLSHTLTLSICPGDGLRGRSHSLSTMWTRSRSSLSLLQNRTPSCPSVRDRSVPTGLQFPWNPT